MDKYHLNYNAHEAVGSARNIPAGVPKRRNKNENSEANSFRASPPEGAGEEKEDKTHQPLGDSPVARLGEREWTGLAAKTLSPINTAQVILISLGLIYH